MLFSVFSINVLALTKKAYQYVCQDNSVIEYYLDENLNPYKYVNGEKIYLALPLEHLKITDPDLITELESERCCFLSPAVTLAAEPTNYFDLSTGAAAQNSIAYTRTITNMNTVSTTTAVLKLNPSHEVIRIKTTNLIKVHVWNMSKIKFIYAYYATVDASWHALNAITADCTGAVGFGFEHAPDINPYGRFSINKDSGIKSLDLSVWTTRV